MRTGQGGAQKHRQVFDAIEKKKPNEVLNGCDLGKSQCSSRPREKEVALIETWWDNNLDKSFSCEEEKVEYLWLKTLNTGTGKQDDVYWPEKEGKSLSTTWIVSAETSPPRRLSFPSHIVQLPPLTLLPSQLSVIIWMSIFSSAKRTWPRKTEGL